MTAAPETAANLATPKTRVVRFSFSSVSETGLAENISNAQQQLQEQEDLDVQESQEIEPVSVASQASTKATMVTTAMQDAAPEESFPMFRPTTIVPQDEEDEDYDATQFGGGAYTASSSLSSLSSNTAYRPVSKPRPKGFLSHIFAADNANANRPPANPSSASASAASSLSSSVASQGYKRTKSLEDATQAAMYNDNRMSNNSGASAAHPERPPPITRSRSWATEADGAQGRNRMANSPMSEGTLFLDKSLVLRFSEGTEANMPTVELHKCRHCSKLYPRTVGSPNWNIPQDDQPKSLFCSGECYLTQAVIRSKRSQQQHM